MNKTQADARKILQLYFFEPVALIPTFEFIISSICVVSNQSEYIRMVTRVAMSSVHSASLQLAFLGVQLNWQSHDTSGAQ